MLIPDEDLNKVEVTRVDILELQKKIQEANDRKEDKIRMMKVEKEEKELEGCTFAPVMYTKKNKKVTEEKRDLSKFLEDQKKYEEARQ